MKIRKGYKTSNLKTKSVKLQLLGGEKDYCAYSAGYYAGEKHLSPSRKFALYNSDAPLKNFETIGYFDNIGVGIAVTTVGQIYKWTEASLGTPFAYSGLVGTYLHSVFPCYYEGAPAVAVASGPRLTFVTAEKYINKQIPFQLKGACYHMGRIFAADAKDNCVIRWSGTDFTDWKQSAAGSGYIRLSPERGAIYRVIPFGDRLVVLRKYGLDIIKAYGDPRHFAVVHQGGRSVTELLVEDACAVCGGKIYFCSYDKIFCYDGESISSVNLPEYMKASDFHSGKSHDGRYVHFYCRSEADGKYFQLELDTLKGTGCFFACGIKHVWKTDSGFWAWNDNKVYKEDGEGDDMPSTWRTGNINLGSAKVKTLKSVYVDTADNVKLTVSADGIERRFAGSGEKRVGLSGRNFTFEVSGNGRTSLLEAEWEVRV